jgi:hypothetical protein
MGQPCNYKLLNMHHITLAAKRKQTLARHVGRDTVRLRERGTEDTIGKCKLQNRKRDPRLQNVQEA